MTGKRKPRDSTSACITTINLDDDAHSSINQLAPIFASKPGDKGTSLEVTTQHIAILMTSDFGELGPNTDIGKLLPQRKS